MGKYLQARVIGAALVACWITPLAQAGRPAEKPPRLGDLPAVTQEELATVVPNCFAVAYGPRVWLRVDDRHWIERYGNGTERKYHMLGRTRARGRVGILVAKIAGDPGRTGNGNDGQFQVFIPDKGEVGADLLFRHLGQGDSDWYSLGPMRSIE